MFALQHLDELGDHADLPYLCDVRTPLQVEAISQPEYPVRRYASLIA
jgi:hypothetical protein